MVGMVLNRVWKRRAACRPRRRSVAPGFVAAVATTALLAAGCAELEPPEAYTATTGTTLVEGVEQETDSQIQERPGFSGSVDEFVPTPDPDYLATLLVSGSPFLLAADGEESGPLEEPLGEVEGRLIVDDLGGGLVVQDLAGPIVYWQAQRQPEPLADEIGTELLDVGYWDGSPRAFVEVGSGRVDWIQLVSEQPGSDRERVTHLELEEGNEIVDFSASRDLQALIVQDGECGELRIYGEDGQTLDRLVPDPAQCTFPGRPAYGAVALSPDGGAVAYTIVTYNSDGTEAGTEIEARELGADNGYYSRRIGESLDTVTSLSFDGDRVAYLKQSLAGPTVTLLNLTADRQEVPVGLADTTEVYSVSFARMPVGTVG